MDKLASLKTLSGRYANRVRHKGSDDQEACELRRELCAAMLARCINRYGQNLLPAQVETLCAHLHEVAAEPWPHDDRVRRPKTYPSELRRGRPHAPQTDDPTASIDTTTSAGSAE